VVFIDQKLDVSLGVPNSITPALSIVVGKRPHSPTLFNSDMQVNKEEILVNFSNAYYHNRSLVGFSQQQFI